MVGYVNVRQVRKMIGADPELVTAKSIGTGDGSNKNFYIPNKFLADWDGDDEVTSNDYTVYVNGSSATVAKVYPDKGQFVMATAPASNAVITADYAYANEPDSEIQVEIDKYSKRIDRITGNRFSRGELDTQYFNGDGIETTFHFRKTPMYKLESYLIDTVSTGLVEGTDYWLQPDPKRALWIEFFTPPLSIQPQNVKLVYKYGESDSIVEDFVSLNAAKALLRYRMNQAKNTGFYSVPSGEQKIVTPSKPFTLYRLYDEELKKIMPLIPGTIRADVVT